MARYLGLIVFALSTVIIDCFFLNVVERPPSEIGHWNVQSTTGHDAFTESDQTTEAITEAKQGLRNTIIKIFLFGHAICTLMLTFALYKKLRRYQCSHQWMEKELRLTKAESSRAAAALLQKTSEQMEWLHVMTDSVKELEKALKEKHVLKIGTSKKNIHLN